jgi:hypothetical protein
MCFLENTWNYVRKVGIFFTDNCPERQASELHTNAAITREPATPSNLLLSESPQATPREHTPQGVLAETVVSAAAMQEPAKEEA